MNVTIPCSCRPVFYSVITAILFLLVSCSQSSNTEQWSVNEVWQRAQNDNSVVILDVRSEQEYRQGHVPNAVNIPIASFEKGLPELPFAKETTTVVYCRSGPRAYHVQSLLRDAGYSRVYDMRGHFSAWQEMKLPIESKGL